MNQTAFRHDWEPHYWRSAVRQKLVGYRSCRNCGRGEWLSGDIQPGDRPEETCQAEVESRIGTPRFVQLQLFEWGMGS